jgi:hypothetical protein
MFVKRMKYIFEPESFFEARSRCYFCLVFARAKRRKMRFYSKIT